MRRIVISVIVLVVGAGLTAPAALASSPHLKKGGERSCVIPGSPISKSVFCRAIPTLSASAPDNNGDGNTLPYDEFGLTANQPNQPRVGSDGTLTRRDAAGLTAPNSAADSEDVSSNDAKALPYDEFGLAANQPSRPRVGGDGTQTRRG